MHPMLARPTAMSRFATAGLGLILAACTDPIAPTAAVQTATGTAPRPNLDLVAQPTITLKSGVDPVYVCPEDQARTPTAPSPCFQALAVSASNGRWHPPLAGTSWISNSLAGNVPTSTPPAFHYYKTVFTLPAGVTDASLTVTLYADRAATVYLNGTQFGQQRQADYSPNFGCVPSQESGGSACSPTGQPSTYTTTTGLVAGVNVLTFRVLNVPGAQPGATCDPDGDAPCPSATGLDVIATISYKLNIGRQGCSHGYWKNHEWTDTAPYTNRGRTLGSIFTGLVAALAGQSLQAGLEFRGGPGLQGAQQILMRQAVAALLNAASTGVGYPLTTAQVISMVNAALASGNRQTILQLADQLDRYNNLGCPLSGRNIRQE